jgi:hypothetical protein
MVGVDLHQDHVFGIAVAHDRFAQQSPVVAAGQKVTEARVQRVHLAIGFGDDGLIGVERRESLDFHQLRLQILVDPKINLNEQRMRRFVRNAVFGGDGGG